MFERDIVRSLLIGFLLLALSIPEVITGEVHFKNGAPHVTLTHGGRVSGKIDYSREGRSFSSFTGIPYATIPQRFSEAKLIREPTWEGVKDAVAFGPECTQFSILSVMTSNPETAGEEDCLSLSVYIPMSTAPKKDPYPVMVFIHGGAFQGASQSVFGPRFLIDEDVIVVTINYRLGVFGFLSTEDHVVPGNNGLKDAVIALKWVQENIEQFGGNRDQVTIFGQSAGGASTHYLMLSEKTTGLFNRVISQSGTAIHSWSFHPKPRQLAVKLATYMKCPTVAENPSEISSEEIVACLRSASMEDLNKAQYNALTEWPKKPFFVFAPTLETEPSIESEITPFLTKSPYAILTDRNHELAEIPWMVGVTEDEGAVFFSGIILGNENLTEEMDKDWMKIAPEAFRMNLTVPKENHLTLAMKLREFYFGTQSISVDSRGNLSNLYSDYLFTHGVYRSAMETASRGNRNSVYLYQFAQIPPNRKAFPGDGEKKRVRHIDDMIFLSDEPFIPGSPKLIKPNTIDEEISKNIVKLWVSFAIHGKPTHSWGNSSDREWKPISAEEANGTVPLKYFTIEENPRNIENPYKERVEFWDQLYKDYYEQYLITNKNKPT